MESEDDVVPCITGGAAKGALLALPALMPCITGGVAKGALLALPVALSMGEYGGMWDMGGLILRGGGKN